MPLYDCVLLLKPSVTKASLINLVCQIGKHVCNRNGVVTEIKSFGKVQLGYGVRKLDGRFYEGELMQMTMMATPNMNKELHFLNKEDRLLRWLLVKHRDTTPWMQPERDYDFSSLSRRGLLDARSDDDEEKDDEDEDEDEDDDDDDDDVDEYHETEDDEKREEQ